MSVRRMVPNLPTSDPGAAAHRLAGVLGLEVVMDLGWVVTIADHDRPELQISLLGEDRTAPVRADVSVEVDDLPGAHARAVASGFEILHGPVVETWGVERFLMRDPDGNVVNVLRHRAREPEQTRRPE